MELQLKRIMREQGRTNQWLADQMGISSQYAGQVAKGTSGATLTQYERIAEILLPEKVVGSLSLQPLRPDL